MAASIRMEDSMFASAMMDNEKLDNSVKQNESQNFTTPNAKKNLVAGEYTKYMYIIYRACFLADNIIRMKDTQRSI
jgi:hypothetical protein